MTENQNKNIDRQLLEIDDSQYGINHYDSFVLS